MMLRDDPDIEVPTRCKVAWQLAAERAGLTLRAWLVEMGDAIDAAPQNIAPAPRLRMRDTLNAKLGVR